MAHLEIAHSLPSSACVSEIVTRNYNVGPISASYLLHRGFNDTYLVEPETKERFILRISLALHRLRLGNAIAEETAFLSYLDALGVPVATAIPNRRGALFSPIRFPEGSRPVVLFRYIDGRVPDLRSPEDARAQGVTLAKLHLAADTYPAREEGVNVLDLNHLLHRPVEAILSHSYEGSNIGRDLLALADRLSAAVETLGSDLLWTRCHGDVHGLNARIIESGPNAGRAVFFDFDEGGFGYLAYDLAVHLWSQVSFGRSNFGIWHAFEQGYRSIRTVKSADEITIPIFVAIRHIWLLGEWASGRPRHGWLGANSPAWLEGQLEWLLRWERRNLTERLL